MRKWNKQRYSEHYYEKIMEPIWEERWHTYLKGVKSLKKGIKSLGAIPKKEVQLIKTVKYFVGLINLTTNFADNFPLICAPDAKRDIALQFDDLVKAIVARDKIQVMYLNKSNFGESVTYDNLYVGRFSEISSEEITSDMLTRTICGEIKRVDIELAPITDWLNNRVFSISGLSGYLNQKKLADVDKLLTDNLLNAIEQVLQ